jgi:hypothetical protein
LVNDAAANTVGCGSPAAGALELADEDVVVAPADALLELLLPQPAARAAITRAASAAATWGAPITLCAMI